MATRSVLIFALFSVCLAEFYHVNIFAFGTVSSKLYYWGQLVNFYAYKRIRPKWKCGFRCLILSPVFVHCCAHLSSSFAVSPMRFIWFSIFSVATHTIFNTNNSSSLKFNGNHYKSNGLLIELMIFEKRKRKKNDAITAGETIVELTRGKNGL